MLSAHCRSRKFHPFLIRVVRQNHRMIGADACSPALPWDVVQAAPPACGQESLSTPPAQYSPATCAASSSAASKRQGVDGMDDLVVARPARLVPRRSASHTSMGRLADGVVKWRLSGAIPQDRHRPAMFASEERERELASDSQPSANSWSRGNVRRVSIFTSCFAGS